MNEGPPVPLPDESAELERHSDREIEEAPNDPLPALGASEVQRDLLPEEVLSEDGLKLREILLMEAGDVDTLPIFAEEDGFNLEKAMNELRKYGLLNENDPTRVKLNLRVTIKEEDRVMSQIRSLVL